MDILLAAKQAAKAHGSTFSILLSGDADSTVPESFVDIIEEYRAASNGGADVPDVAVVSVETRGRVGLVHDMLTSSDTPGSMTSPLSAVLLGGTMSVLQGHTFAMWLVPRDAAGGVRTTLEQLLHGRPREELPLAFDESKDVWTHERVPSDQYAPDEKSIWIAWQCPDSPGVMRSVVTTVEDHLMTDEDAPTGAGSFDNGPSDEQTRVAYAISRVLDGGPICAGKLKVSGRRIVIERALNSSHALEKRLERVLTALIDGREPQPRGSVPTVRVSEFEPAQKPWTTLSLSPSAPISAAVD